MAPNPPPRNPFLADSDYAVGHGESAQQDTTPLPGPSGPSRSLTGEDVSYRHVGPAHFGIAISSPYPGGSRVVWSNGGDRIVKLDHDTFDLLAELPLNDGDLVAPGTADEAIARLDREEGKPLLDLGIELAMTYLVGLGGVYYALDRDNTLFVGGSDAVIAYKDANRGDPASAIIERNRWHKPTEVTGSFTGVNMTFDGHLVLVTEHGWVVALSRDFTTYQVLQLPQSEDAVAHTEAREAAGKRGRGWVRNALAVDHDGGIYIASINHMHKVVWDGTVLSADPADGAWTEPYSNTDGDGTGATPSLMGFGDEDRFVVITDGDTRMNVVLFWRDDIPPDSEPLPDAPSPRIAGSAPATMGDPGRTAIQSEQSVVVSGYGAMVVNNEAASIPDGWTAGASQLLIGFLGADPAYTPHGLQKFEWDPDRRQLVPAWVNTDIASPNCVPFVSIAANIVYTIGVRGRSWTVEGLDWATGREVFHYLVGGSRFNSLFSGVAIDQAGRIIYGTPFGKVRINQPGNAAQEQA